MPRFLLCASVLFLAACTPADETGNTAAGMSILTGAGGFESCQRTAATTYAGLVASARCFTLTRPENPDVPDGRQLDLKVMVLPSVRPSPEPDPVVILVGGPGQAATEAGLVPAQLLAAARQRREIVLLDQRGTGANSPLQCEYGEENVMQAPDLNLLINEQEELIRTCLDSLEADPRYYTTDLAVEDLEALRQALGYSQLNLWGGSYGTRMALAYVRQYPEHVRSMVLDGAAPPEIRLPLNAAQDASAALERIFRLCEEEAECAATYPDLRQDFNRLLARLRFPEAVVYADPVTGEEQRGTVNADSVRLLLRTLLYSREYDRLVPYLITQIEAGNYTAMAAVTGAEAGINEGMFLSVVCSEDYSLMSEEQISDAINADELLASDLLVSPVILACEQWPTRELPTEYFEPVESDIPTLVFSGELDPVTPQNWGQLVADRLGDVRHFTVPGVAHITLQYGCVPSLVSEFFESPTPGDVDAQCLQLQGPRPFFLSSGGAARLAEAGEQP